MCSPKSLHNLQQDEEGNYMAETEKGITLKMTFHIPIKFDFIAQNYSWIDKLCLMILEHWNDAIAM